MLLNALILKILDSFKKYVLKADQVKQCFKRSLWALELIDDTLKWKNHSAEEHRENPRLFVKENCIHLKVFSFLYKPLSLVLKSHFRFVVHWVSRVHCVSNGCPTECCHGSQKLALKNAGSRTKTRNVCIMVFRRNVHIQWDFYDCLVLAAYSHNRDRSGCDGVWNHLPMSITSVVSIFASVL